jgi:hypothetical protein
MGFARLFASRFSPNRPTPDRLSPNRISPGRFSPLFLAFLFLSFPSVHALVAKPAAPAAAAAAAKAKKTKPSPDILVLTNGDRITGTLLHSVGDTVSFHSDILGDLQLKWKDIKELQTRTRMVILGRKTSSRHRVALNLPQGTISVANQLITVHSENGAAIPSIPVKDVEYIVDVTTLRKQIAGHPGPWAAWNGSLTAGATVIQASQEQYTFNGAVNLARVAPTVSWLNTNNRTLIDFSGSFGKIIQPAYSSGGVYTPPSSSKESIYHADAERDQYFSPRFYVLAQTVFDHNFAQALDLQQIYGAGVGWTAIKLPTQELDLKTTLQYEGQNFLDASAGVDQNLIGSTLDANWAAKLPFKIVFKQEVSYIPAYNNPYAYSAGETDSLTMPFFKKLAFSLGSIDSYLNDPPAAVPPTRRNSFQFTTGFTYALKSMY